MPADLVGHDTIAFISGQASVWRYQTPTGLYFHERPGRLNIDSSEAMREAALTGIGLIHLPTYITGNDLRDGTLVEVLKPYRASPDPIRVVYASKRQLSPRVRAFIDLLVERWESGLPWET
ncbi:LysR substrate binding domain protein [compost metagenome]